MPPANKNTFSSEEALETLETDSWHVKAMHWSRSDPMTRRGVKARFSHKIEFDTDAVVMDRGGNILSMPFLHGKPCFGIPTAWLQFGGHQPIFVRRMGGDQPSRCMKCPVNDACKTVSKARIQLVPELLGYIKNWLDKGGREGLKTPTKNPRCVSSFKNIARTLRDHPFTSSNDPLIKDYYGQKKRERLEKDRIRKQKKRAQVIREGTLDESVLNWLDEERSDRLKMLKKACRIRPLPPKLRNLNEKSIQNTADVWFAKTTMQIGQSKLNASTIASQLIKEGKHDQQSYPVLRGRIATDLRRIEYLEKVKVANGVKTIWPKFDIIKEVTAFTKRS